MARERGCALIWVKDYANVLNPTNILDILAFMDNQFHFFARDSIVVLTSRFKRNLVAASKI